MKTEILSMMAFVAMIWGAGVARDSLAQTRSETPVEHAKSGHQMNSPSDGAFHHRFEDAERWAKEFDKPEHDVWQKPEEVLDALHLQRTSLVADIGAGTGYLSVRIAKRVPEGKIFAADIELDMVRYLGERARREHLINLVPVQASADAVNLPEPVDVALVVDTYHHIGNRTQYFAKLKSSLRLAGRLVIVDFKVDSPNGPPVRPRISRRGSRKNSRPLATRSWTHFNSCRGNTASSSTRVVPKRAFRHAP